MAHTLTFSGDLTVSVDGQSITSPYTLAKSCTLRFESTNENFGLKVNDEAYYKGTTTIDSADTDIMVNTSVPALTGGSPVIVIVNYTESVTRVSVDLATLTGWDSLSTGTHAITVKAKADGYKDSEASAAVSVEKTAKALPAKGDIITMDGKEYRVLKLDGSVAEVLAMYDPTTPMAFDSNASYNNKYAEKSIDTYCNETFYNSLSTRIKSAIVDKTFTQDSWTRYSYSESPSSPYYEGYVDTTISEDRWYYLKLDNAAYGDSITRHCYIISVQDVLDFVGAIVYPSSGKLTTDSVRKMFWNISSLLEGKNIWLRSAHGSYSKNAFIADGGAGSLDDDHVNYSRVVRPAFQVDLSKIGYESAGYKVAYSKGTFYNNATGVTFYSTDNGVTWIDTYSMNDGDVFYAKQIKLKCANYGSSYAGTMIVYKGNTSESLLSASSHWNTEDISDNLELTEDITLYASEWSD